MSKLEAKPLVAAEGPSKARRDGLTFVLLGSAFFALLGAGLGLSGGYSMVDFKSQYYAARTLVENRDPYSQADVLRTYLSERTDNLQGTTMGRMVITRTNYPPSAFSITAPLAALSFGPAELIWLAGTIVLLIAASLLMWKAASEDAPLLAGSLIGFMLLNSALLARTGNAAGIAIGLCVIGVWSFLTDRYVGIGILSLAVSLVMKPQIAGFVWLYFLLAGGLSRKRAILVVGLLIILVIPVLVWLSAVAPHWPQELHANVQAYQVHGSENDPGPDSFAPKGAFLNLQTVFALFIDDPRFYNTMTYLLCGSMLVPWALTTARGRFTRSNALLALASVSALTNLVVYHRGVDGKLLLLTVPACAMLWTEGRRLGKVAFALTAAGFLCTSEVFWVFNFCISGLVHLHSRELFRALQTVILVLPAPVSLLAIAIFYLWVYLRRAPRLDATEESTTAAGV